MTPSVSIQMEGGVFAVAASLLADTLAVCFDRNSRLDIPANTSLEDALIEWGIGAGLTIMIDTRTVNTDAANRAGGTIRALKAIELRSGHSGLMYGAKRQIVPRGYP
jgi:hypothetical protein